jgi:hypothetical protein
LDHVENGNPLKNPMELPNGQYPGGLDGEGETMDEKVAAVEGLRSGGVNASDGG